METMAKMQAVNKLNTLYTNTMGPDQMTNIKQIFSFC